MKHELSSFLSGCAASSEFIFFAKQVDAAAEAGSPNSTFLSFVEDDAEPPFAKYDQVVGWPAITMATSKPVDALRLVVALGPNGDYWELEPLSTQERVGKIPEFSGNLRNLAVIDDDMYACGMGRIVLLRQGTGKWQSIGPQPAKGDPDVIGFEDIGGYNKDEMYAAGWGGEIWWRDAKKWRRVDSPTSTNLRALFCADDAVYIVGHNGTLVRGRHDAWEVVDTGRKENLMDVTAHDGEIFVCTSFRILKMVGDKLVNDMDFGDAADLPTTCLYLVKAPDGLISIGEKDVFRRKDGVWKRLV
jgi:hypothetical protein